MSLVTFYNISKSWIFIFSENLTDLTSRLSRRMSNAPITQNSSGRSYRQDHVNINPALIGRKRPQSILRQIVGFSRCSFNNRGWKRFVFKHRDTCVVNWSLTCYKPWMFMTISRNEHFKLWTFLRIARRDITDYALQTVTYIAVLNWT